VERTIANDPLARQYIVDAAVEDAHKRGGRSTAGKGGTRAWRGKSTRKF
jgi:excinuclease ABC subunit B